MNIPVIANGDVYTRADMASIKALSGCRCNDRFVFHGFSFVLPHAVLFFLRRALYIPGYILYYVEDAIPRVCWLQIEDCDAVRRGTRALRSS